MLSLNEFLFQVKQNCPNTLNKKGDPNKRVGWDDFFVYYIKNSVAGGNFFRLLHEKQGEGVKVSKIK
jgi:hypothetical protein